MHQSNKSEYQIRINGSPVDGSMLMDRYLINDFAKVCEQNPNESVDIVLVRTEILMNQFSYHQMKRHFAENQNEQA